MSKNEKEKQDKQQIQTSPDGEISIFAAVSAFVLLVSAVTTLLGFMTMAKPLSFFAGTIYDTNEYDADVLATAIFENADTLYKSIIIASVATTVVVLLMGILGIIRSMKPDKKPGVAFSIIVLLMAIVAMGLMVYFYVKGYSLAKVTLPKIPRQISMNFLLGYFIMTIVNAVAGVINVFSSMAAFSKWEETQK